MQLLVSRAEQCVGSTSSNVTAVAVGPAVNVHVVIGEACVDSAAGDLDASRGMGLFVGGSVEFGLSSGARMLDERCYASGRFVCVCFWA